MRYNRTAPVRPLKDRFWEKVAIDPDGCWLWTGAVNNKGYGQILRGGAIRAGKKLIYAHRASWELANGQIPDGLFVLHRCDVPNCVRPDHLFLGTIRDNSLDMIAKGRGTSPAAKLDENQVREIRRRLAAGARGAHLAIEYGVCNATISNIRNGHRCKKFI